MPSGTVTFLFTDIESSTSHWDREPVAMGDALVRHDSILQAAVDGHAGYVFSRAGDGLAAAFGRCDQALGAALAAQRALGAEKWPTSVALRVRMGLHVRQRCQPSAGY